MLKLLKKLFDEDKQLVGLCGFKSGYERIPLEITSNVEFFRPKPQSIFLESADKNILLF